MIPAISPEVFRGRNHRTLRWIVSVTLYALGATLASAVIGAALGWTGSRLVAGMPVLNVFSILAAITLFYGLHELSLIRLPHPQTGWQVPSGWRRFHPWVTAFSYGAYLGLGVLHYTLTTTFLVVLCWVFLLADTSLSAATMSMFALGQALYIAATARNVHSLDTAYEAGCRVLQWKGAVRMVNGIVLIAASVLLGLGLLEDK
jgi:hypothetical protein